jgi:hypothetical protein
MVGIVPDARDLRSLAASSLDSVLAEDTDGIAAVCDEATTRYGAEWCSIAVSRGEIQMGFDIALGRPSAGAHVPAFRAFVARGSELVAWTDFGASVGSAWTETRSAVFEWAIGVSARRESSEIQIDPTAGSDVPVILRGIHREEE